MKKKSSMSVEVMVYSALVVAIVIIVTLMLLKVFKSDNIDSLCEKQFKGICVKSQDECNLDAGQTCTKNLGGCKGKNPYCCFNDENVI
jgi:hypothetical protein